VRSYLQRLSDALPAVFRKHLGPLNEQEIRRYRAVDAEWRAKYPALAEPIADDASCVRRAARDYDQAAFLNPVAQFVLLEGLKIGSHGIELRYRLHHRTLGPAIIHGAVFCGRSRLDGRDDDVLRVMSDEPPNETPHGLWKTH
jgi:hypothetical protein